MGGGSGEGGKGGRVGMPGWRDRDVIGIGIRIGVDREGKGERGREEGKGREGVRSEI